ncbi:MAG: endonuclease/exonuclease/phosphatase family protein [Dichotomicrobium sp.]
MRIATFNVQNMRLRTRQGRPVLDGARDWDAGRPEPDPALDVIDRRLTAEVIHAIAADVIALQEVYDQATLDHFHDAILLPTGAAPYPYRHCLPGNDGRGRNLAVMSRCRPERVASHADATAAELGLSDVPASLRSGPLFRRDCLEVELAALSLFICHFKAPYPDRQKARAVREAEARGVRAIIERRFARPATAWWMILGDLNDPAAGVAPARSAIRPLTEGFAVDLMARLDEGEDWTYRYPASHLRSRPDAMLASPALARAFPEVRPEIFRAGMDPDAAAAEDRRFRAVTATRPHASDHAAIYADFAGLESVR